MIASSRAPRWSILLVFCLLGLSTAASPALAQTPTPAVAMSTRPAAALVAGWMDGITGNRSKMIQLAFIGFGIGVAILMTATRKH